MSKFKQGDEVQLIDRDWTPTRVVKSPKTGRREKIKVSPSERIVGKAKILSVMTDEEKEKVFLIDEDGKPTKVVVYVCETHDNGPDQTFCEDQLEAI